MMNHEEHLLACFQEVFPGKSKDELRSSSRDSTREWDSMASVTLLTLIQQEFAVDMDLFDLENLSSFQLLLDHLRQGADMRESETKRG